MTDDQDALREEVRQLREELARLNEHRFLRTYNSTWKFMAFNFARGVMVALGGIIGASVVLSMVIWSLSQIEFVPIIGDYAKQVIEIVQSAQDGVPEVPGAPGAATGEGAPEQP
jgi:type IV secretory pathway TrbF-like protein